jgi:single-stranded DNA-binding protein
MINIIQLSGYLIREIEIKTEEGEIIASSTIAVFQKNNQRIDNETLVVDLVFKRECAVFALEKLNGGSKIFVEGQFKEKQSKKYVDVKVIHILDCNTQFSSSNGFSVSSSISLDSDKTEEDQNLFNDSIDIDEDEGVKFKF